MNDDCPRISLVVEIGVCFLVQIAEVIKDELWPNPLKYFNSDVSFYSTQCLASSAGLGSKPPFKYRDSVWEIKVSGRSLSLTEARHRESGRAPLQCSTADQGLSL
jgi:hypothetical protein